MLSRQRCHEVHEVVEHIAHHEVDGCRGLAVQLDTGHLAMNPRPRAKRRTLRLETKLSLCVYQEQSRGQPVVSFLYWALRERFLAEARAGAGTVRWSM